MRMINKKGCYRKFLLVDGGGGKEMDIKGGEENAGIFENRKMLGMGERCKIRDVRYGMHFCFWDLKGEGALLGCEYRNFFKHG